jgi:pimeloyl-ACP methyl ester carboxylesterase
MDGEGLADYAIRLAEQIDTREPFVLIGCSLGGLMSVEIAKRYPPVATILISSIPVHAHLPPYFRLAHRLRLNKWIPASFLKKATNIKHGLLVKSPADRKLLREMVEDGDDRFINWAIDAVLHWENKTIPSPFFHIHGTRDEVFPIKMTRPTHRIPHAGHMFLMSRPAELNTILAGILGSI